MGVVWVPFLGVRVRHIVSDAFYDVFNLHDICDEINNATQIEVLLSRSNSPQI